MGNSWKKFIVGEPMPDKDDPKYKERYEREVAAGKRFADKTGISWLGGRLQAVGQAHRKTFLTVTFGIVFTLLFLNVSRLATAYRQLGWQPTHTAVERIDSALFKSHRINHRFNH